MLNKVHQEAGGQAAVYQYDDRYFRLLGERFGERFHDYRRQWAARSERSEAGDFPLSLDLAVNSGCQLSCLMCPLPGRPRRPLKLMDDALFTRLMSESAERGLPAATLGLGGEPLLHPRITELAARAMRAGIMDVRLGTNGLLLTPEMIARFLDAGLSRLEISLDAARPETYRAIRRGGDFVRLTRIIETFLEQRERAGQKFPLLRLSFLKLDLNRGELPDFLARWEGRADLISIQEPIWFPGSALPPPEGPLNSQAATCAQPWQRLALNCDGRAWPCCSWYGEELLPFNAAGLSVAQIWASPEMAAIRAALSGGRPPAPCQGCLF